MTHSDDDGLRVPPRIAPQQVVILPIVRNDQDEAAIMTYCQTIQQSLQNSLYHDRSLT